MDLVDLIQQANADFDRRVQERHDAGAEKYGPLAFFDKNTVEEAMQEVLDLANYARYTFIKLWLMNEALDKALGGEPITVGGGFFTGRPDLSTIADQKKGQQ